MKKILLFLALVSSLPAMAQAPSYQEYFTKAREAYNGGDPAQFYNLILEAHKLHPYHQGILYHVGIAAALNDKPQEAIIFLNKAIQINAGFDLATPDLNSIKNRDDFKKLLTLQAELKTPIIQSDTAFIVHDKTLHLECIASGEAKNIFYLGSIHKRKIIRIDENGVATDFTNAAQDGLCAVFGIKTDATKNVLWACSSPVDVMENPEVEATSGVYKYDLATRKLLMRYPAEENKKSIFGDLVISPQGNIFVSDSRNSIIFVLNEVSGKLEEYFTSDEFRSVQGICFTPDGKYLFIADYVRGIFRLTTKDKTLIRLAEQFPLSTKSIDGLTFYNNSLIAIQNLVSPMRVTQYFLNDKHDALTHYRIIDRAHPAYNEPTIGCHAGDDFYYIANSLWSGYTDKHALKPLEQLQEVVILKKGLNDRSKKPGTGSKKQEARRSRSRK